MAEIETVPRFVRVVDIPRIVTQLRDRRRRKGSRYPRASAYKGKTVERECWNFHSRGERPRGEVVRTVAADQVPRLCISIKQERSRGPTLMFLQRCESLESEFGGG
jgi:hypothetical protein